MTAPPPAYASGGRILACVMPIRNAIATTIFTNPFLRKDSFGFWLWPVVEDGLCVIGSCSSLT